MSVGRQLQENNCKEQPREKKLTKERLRLREKATNRETSEGEGDCKKAAEQESF